MGLGFKQADLVEEIFTPTVVDIEVVNMNEENFTPTVSDIEVLQITGETEQSD